MPNTTAQAWRSLNENVELVQSSTGGGGAIRQAIQEGHTTYGMQTCDQSRRDLFTRNLITLDQALRFASNPAEFQLRVEGIHATSDTSRVALSIATSACCNSSL